MPTESNEKTLLKGEGKKCVTNFKYMTKDANERETLRGKNRNIATKFFASYYFRNETRGEK